MTQDRVKQRPHVVAVRLHVRLGESAETASEQVREIALIVIGAELDEQIQHLVHSRLGIHPGTVDFVDEHDRAQTLLQCLLQHESRLGHRPLVGVDNQQTAIHHSEHPLHFTAEIGVTRGVNNVDAGVVVIDSRVFRQNGDAALTLQIVGVHDAGGHRFVVAEDA